MEKKGAQRRPGRPKLRPNQVRRRPIVTCTTEELVERLRAAAEASRRSLAREIEYRLQRSFDDEDKVASALNLGIEVGSQIGEALAELDKGALILAGYHGIEEGAEAAKLADLVLAQREKLAELQRGLRDLKASQDPQRLVRLEGILTALSRLVGRE